MKLFYTDLETTGLNPETNTIIEIATIYTNTTTKETATFHMFILPESKPDDFETIEEITGITWNFLEVNGRPEKEVFTCYQSWLCRHIAPYNKNDKGFFCGYNANFDSDFMYHFFKKNSGEKDHSKGNFFHHTVYDILNTVVQAEIIGAIPVQKSRKLQDVCNFFNIPIHAHRAIDDIRATTDLSRLLWMRIKDKIRAS